VCLISPEPLYAISWHYEDFTQTSDQEVVALLNEAHTWSREVAQ
jgi:putative phosphoribosyl transferase